MLSQAVHPRIPAGLIYQYSGQSCPGTLVPRTSMTHILVTVSWVVFRYLNNRTNFLFGYRGNYS